MFESAHLNRRELLNRSLAGVSFLTINPSLGFGLDTMTSSHPFLTVSPRNIGKLKPVNKLGAKLPPKYSLRVIAESGKPVSLKNGKKSSYIWHSAPDGGATFDTKDDGWIYVSNSERSHNLGGVGAIRFDKDGNILDAYPILEKTNRNCAGGPTPWQTWLSCEEYNRGLVYECDPFGNKSAVKCTALGSFQHEAAAVDPDRGHIYMTEDEPDGCFYRFTPASISNNGKMDLSSGLLEIATNKLNEVIWKPVPRPNPSILQSSTRKQLSNALHFNGGEGIWYHEKLIFFTSKGDNRVWIYDPSQNRFSILYDLKTAKTPILSGVDNITASSSGQLLIGEDGGNMQIVVLGLDGAIAPLVQLENQSFSEITGPAITSNKERLYFSSQRGPRLLSNGITYEIKGPLG